MTSTSTQTRATSSKPRLVAPPETTPLELVLTRDARDIVAFATRGREDVVWLNAGLGRNAALLGNVRLHLDPNPLVADVYPADVPDPRLQAVVADNPRLHSFLWNGGFRCAPVTNTGLPGRSVHTLVIDHLEFEADREALAKEILRITAPGGSVVSITYGIPRPESELLYRLAAMADPMITNFDGLPIDALDERAPVRYLNEELCGPSTGTQHSAGCKANLDETLTHLARYAVAGERPAWSEPRRHLDTYVNLLRAQWDTPEKAENLTFMVSFDALWLS